MNYFKTQSPRHSTEKTENSIVVTINSRRNLGTILFLTLGNFMWIYMVSVLSIMWWGMLLAATGIMDPEYRGMPVFIMVLCALSISLLLLLSFGAFGIYRFLWEIAGKEFIEVDQDKLIIARQLFSWKRTSEFSNKKINKLTTRNTKQSLFWFPFQKRYRYAFELNHDGKIHRFGYLVKEQEANEISTTIQAFILPAP